MSVIEDKVVTTYEARADQHKATVEMLRSSQQAFAAEVAKGLESQNKKLEQTIGKWAAVGAGIAGIATAFKFAASAWHAYVDRANMEAQTYGVNIDKLRAASAGLKTDTELLAFAEKAQTRDLALTRNEMDLVLKAQVALARNGRDAAKVEEAVGEALTKNTVKPLKEIGIILRQNEDPAKNFEQIMRALGRASSDAGAAQAEVGENVQRAGVAVENAWTNLTTAAGHLIDHGLSPLAGWLAKLANEADSVVTGIKIGTKESDPAGYAEAMKHNRQTHEGAALSEVYDEVFTKGWKPMLQRGTVGLAVWQGTVESTLKNMAGIQKDTLAIASRARALRRQRKPVRGPAGDGGKALEELTAWDAEYGVGIENGDVASLGGGFGGGALAGSDFAGALGGYNERSSREGRYGAFNAKRSESKLAQIFGPIEEFNAYQEAFAALTGAVTAGMDAWITGSMSAGAAIKRFIAEALRATASQLAIKALEHGAYALGSIAFGDPAGAARHGIAAAAFGAGAVAAGIAAKALGAGQSTQASAGGGAAPTTSPSSGASAGGGRPVVVVYGDSFAQLTDRQRAVEARRLVQTGIATANNRGVVFQ